jgi:poly-gamma-glutamate synthesis protein (capsule biosynthesis protein)
MDEELPDAEAEEVASTVRQLFRRLLILNRRLHVIAVALLATLPSGGCRRPRPPRAEPVVRLVAVGDVLLARGVGGHIKRDGAAYPFANVKDIISGADLAFCNLECTLSRRGIPQRRRFRFRADPALASTLRATGFDVASLANNHTMDFGRDALLDTVDAVRGNGIVPVGAGEDRAEALRVQVIETKGLRIGFVAYTDISSGGAVRLGDRPTVAGAYEDEIPDLIRQAKSRCDVLVVSFHWGVEYMTLPTERQKRLARLCIDNGADLILGHHPHVLQTTEVYKSKPIIYSMGAFVWDPILPRTDRSAIYQFDLSKSSARLTRAVPIRIVGCRPEVGAN